MSSTNRNEAAARHVPVAHQRRASSSGREDTKKEVRRSSGTRLQAAVVRQDERADRDPYADVPCTD